MSPTSRLDCVVIGAGVVGLAVARALALEGREVVVLERSGRFGEGQSSRNSEVIHAGIYYPPGSLKAATCVRGRELLYEYCAARHVPHRRLGKLIVATAPAELATLQALMERGRKNGVGELQWLDPAALEAIEPALVAAGALHSPSSGIIDAHALMLALVADFEAAGGQIVYATGVQRLGQGPEIVVADGARYRASLVVNAAGLHAHRLLMESGWPGERIPEVRWNKGNYFSYSAPVPFSHLIYPIPDGRGLGIHLTLDLAGGARFGPDAHWVDEEDYQVEADRLPRFVEAVKRYFPELDADALSPDYAGIRATALGGDFVVHGPDLHGASGIVNLLGIDSPGLTACMALAERVVDRWGRAAGHGAESG